MLAARITVSTPFDKKTIGDMLQICPISRHGWFEAETRDAILMSFDPVAHDTTDLVEVSLG